MINKLKIAYSKYALKIFLTLLASSLIYSCSNDDDPEDIHEHENITRVTLEFYSGDECCVVREEFTWDDGSTPPTLTLSADSEYFVIINFYDASDPNNIEDITPEIEEEANEHYVLYEKAGVSNLTITSSGIDISGSDGIPINLLTDWSTGAAESGNVVVHLIHEPTNKNGTTRASFGGANDVEINFPVTIQ